MSLFQRGDVWWYEFRHKGRRIRRSANTTNKKLARDIESTTKTALLKSEAGIVDKETVPTLRQFESRFLNEITVRSAERPDTIDYYTRKYQALLKYPPMANAALDCIDEKLISQFVAKVVQADYARATVNHALRTLKRALRLAVRWNIIGRAPHITMLSDENQREFVLSRDDEPNYLDACSAFLRRWAIVAIDTGMRRKEMGKLLKGDLNFEPVGGNALGLIHIRGKAKSKYSNRTIPMTQRVYEVLKEQVEVSRCGNVFCKDEHHNEPSSISAISHAHIRARAQCGFGGEFVLHSLRHTFGTRLGESGVDAFTIQRLMGHSTILVSQRYVHPTAGQIERAMEAMEKLNVGTPYPQGKKSTHKTPHSKVLAFAAKQ